MAQILHVLNITSRRDHLERIEIAATQTNDKKNTCRGGTGTVFGNSLAISNIQSIERKQNIVIPKIMNVSES